MMLVETPEPDALDQLLGTLVTQLCRRKMQDGKTRQAPEGFAQSIGSRSAYAVVAEKQVLEADVDGARGAAKRCAQQEMLLETRDTQ